MTLPALWRLRGGGAVAPIQDFSALWRVRGGGAIAPLQDFSPAAADLFSNMRVPAALIAGAVIPFGFAAMPKPTPGEARGRRLAKITSALLASFTLATELITIVYATVAVNKLREVTSEPSSSLMDLLRRDYEMGWLGVNVHFFAGLMSLAVMSSISVWLNFGMRVGRAAAFGASAAVCLMIAIVNNGISQGDGTGDFRFGGNLLTLTIRYLTLLARNGFYNGPRFLLWAALAFAVAFAFSTYHALVNAEDGDGA